MVNSTNAICSLDYLVGTLATAYKGNITSLVAKDFCMNEEGGETTMRGTVLAIPEGDYEASLNQSGVEFSRVVLKNGSFVFKADSLRIAKARDLQIDIVQSGRHIGTFLLKKLNADGLYISAVELSEELAGIDLTLLTSPLRDKVGLLRKAEDIVSQVHSTKKDWAAFSEKVSDFALDFYWSSTEAFYRAFGILARFTILAAEHTNSADQSKPISNYFDLLDLLIEHESDMTRLSSLTELWTILLTRSSIDLSPQVRRAATSLERVRDKFPNLDLRALVLQLITSLRNATASQMFLYSRVLDPLAAMIPAGDAEMLARFGQPGYRRMAQALHEAELRVEKGDIGGAVGLIAGLDFDILDDRRAVGLLFDIAEKDLSQELAGPLIEVIAIYLSTASHLSGRAVENISTFLPGILERLISLDKSELCAELLRRINESGSVLKDRIMLTPAVARSILHSGRSKLIAQYRDGLRAILIPAARVRGISPDTWAEFVNPLHLEQLTRFMKLLGVGGALLENVLVQVTANLAVGGVLIPDDRLFQRRVSAYLNSLAMEGSYLLNFLLLSMLPVYFNDVGAVNRIRDYSTELDAWGNDAVIYFLRKQVHVNASSNNIRLIEHVLKAWVLNDPRLVKNVVAIDIAAKADPWLMARYAAIINPFFKAVRVLDEKGLHLERVLQLDDDTIDKRLYDSENDDAEARTKVNLLCKLYKEISRKYSLMNRDVAIYDVHAGLLDTVARLKELKSIILSQERTEPQESLYFKRHIAFGIPSVLGTYHERKFDALCELMRRGEEVPVLLEMIITEVEKKGSTAANNDQRKWLISLSAAWQALKQYGMQNVRIDEFITVLEQDRLHPTQIIDVLKMWQKELAWLVSSISRIFHEPLQEILEKFPQEDLPEHLLVLNPSSPGFVGKAVDAVLRDILSSIPGFVESDRLLDGVITALRSQTERVDVREKRGFELLQVREFYDIHAVPAKDALRLGPILGNKAKNLILAKQKGLNVPAGVVLPAGQAAVPAVDQDKPDFLPFLQKAVKSIETKTGRTFGGTRHPLFLSVRSGSYPSMPGILNSILYCGMNEETVDAFISDTGNPELGLDSYRRFIEHYGTSVLGLSIEFFEDVSKGYREAHSLDQGVPLEGAHLKSIVSLYKHRLHESGLQVPPDVYEQLQRCIGAVYNSWDSERARRFRSATGTSEAWGTSVMLMEMVPGNQQGGGASVFFTRDPNSGEQNVYGETRENASGDDLASGRTFGRPLSRRQGESMRKSLETTDLELYLLHQKLAKTIEEAFGDLPQEVEATYTRDRNGTPCLFVLQTRRMEEHGGLARTFDDICSMETRVIGRGIGANGGALSGVASFDDVSERIESLGRKSSMPVILIRKTANTDDVSLMPAIKGIITASGGVTSHAAVLAHTFGLAAVVACADLKIDTDEQGCVSAIIGTTHVQEGTLISIDGRTGLVFSGICAPDQ
jgi:pyruvate, orthophosphate dikinase